MTNSQLLARMDHGFWTLAEGEITEGMYYTVITFDFDDNNDPKQLYAVIRDADTGEVCGIDTINYESIDDYGTRLDPPIWNN